MKKEQEIDEKSPIKLKTKRKAWNESKFFWKEENQKKICSSSRSNLRYA